MTVDFTEIEGWVRAEFAAGRQAGVVDIGEVSAHPGRDLVVCTLSCRDDVDADLTTRVAVVDVETGHCEVLDVGPAASHSATWAPTGDRLALVATDAGGVASALIVGFREGMGPATVLARLPAVSGAVESVAWSPSGERLCVVVAEFEAEVSDVYGSGTVAGPDSAESWRPVVEPAGAGRRLLHIWDPEAGTVDVVSPGSNVWEAGWSGPGAIIVVTSEGAGEGAWYGATLAVVDLIRPVMVASTLRTSTVQMAQPRGNPSGDRWSVIEARASDRGLLAGDVIVGSYAGDARRFDTGGVDVTAQSWLDDRRIGYAGIRDLDTVFGVLDTGTATFEEVFTTDGSSGLYQPDLGAQLSSGCLVTVVERHDLPPALVAVSPRGARDLMTTTGPGTAHVIERSGRTSHCSWTSSDGLRIDGLLTVPDTDGPHPLVINIHGGPVAAWRDGWIGKDPYAALLAARGFAVLRPNPRGSAGRGQAFIEAVVGDMGGTDVDDIVNGALAMVDRGVTEAGRIGITGNSYGGYMAAWIPCWSDVFAAAAVRSPVTDWRSQHLTGNLAEFDEIFVGGDPFDPDSPYVTRSPLTYHRRIKTPMLFTAGARDLATPASQAQQLYAALHEAGVPSQLAIYPEEGHGVRKPAALADQLARMIAWFEKYL